MRDNGCAAATDVLGHADLGVLHLVGSSRAAQLLHQLNNLVDAGGPYGVAAALEAAHGADRQLTVNANGLLVGRSPHLYGTEVQRRVHELAAHYRTISPVLNPVRSQLAELEKTQDGKGTGETRKITNVVSLARRLRALQKDVAG